MHCVEAGGTLFLLQLKDGQRCRAMKLCLEGLYVGATLGVQRHAAVYDNWCRRALSRCHSSIPEVGRSFGK